MNKVSFQPISDVKSIRPSMFLDVYHYCYGIVVLNHLLIAIFNSLNW